LLRRQKNRIEKVTSKTKTLSAEVKKQVDQWKARERQILGETEQKNKDLLAKGIKLDNMHIKKLAADESNYRKSLKVLAEWEKKLGELQKVREGLLKKRLEISAVISKNRTVSAAKANQTLKSGLTDLFVNVKFTENTLSPEAEQIITEAMNWRTS
jgi:hypothetical protein